MNRKYLHKNILKHVKASNRVMENRFSYKTTRQISSAVLDLITPLSNSKQLAPMQLANLTCLWRSFDRRVSLSESTASDESLTRLSPTHWKSLL